MKANMIKKTLAVLMCLSLAVCPGYADVDVVGVSIDTDALANLCEGSPAELDQAILETFNGLEPEAQEFFTQELSDLANSATEAGSTEQAQETLYTEVAEVAPDLVRMIAPTQEGAGLNTAMAGMVQDFLTTAPDVLANNPEMAGMLNAAEQQLEFLAANEAVQQAGFENFSEAMHHIMQEGGGSLDGMMNAAREIFGTGEFASMFENGVPDFMAGQIENMGNFLEAMETHGQEIFAGGEFNPEVMSAAFEGPIPPEMLAMMENFAEGMDPSQMEFNPEMFQEMFMEHMESGEMPYFGPEGNEGGFQPFEFEGNMGDWTPEQFFEQGEFNPEFFMENMTPEQQEMYQEFEQEHPDMSGQREDLIQQQFEQNNPPPVQQTEPPPPPPPCPPTCG